MRSIIELLFGVSPPRFEPSPFEFVDATAEHNRHTERMAELQVERIKAEAELLKQQNTAWKYKKEFADDQ